MDAIPQVVEPAEHASAGDDLRSHVREDGTLVIDILAEVPCESGSEDEIVVCAPARSIPAELAPAPPVEAGARAEVQLSKSVKLRARGESVPESGADRAMIDVVMRF